MTPAARAIQESAAPHIPVMCAEVTEALSPRDGAVFIDGTFGAGGYAQALLNAADCAVIAIDRDPDAISEGADLARRFAGRLTLVAGRFGDMDEIARARGIAAVDGVALDLGVSSMQLDRAERGFSFRADGPLDMRMEQAGRSAEDAVNTLPEESLSDILWTYGEERFARKIAAAIVAARMERPIARTSELAEIVRRVTPRSRDGIDPATRSFQALRIWINDELGEIERGLAAAERILAPGGRLAVVSFHSLEDRAVKAFFQDASGRTPRGSRHRPEMLATAAPTFERAERQTPTVAEIAQNPRARSARLRAAVRTHAPARPAIRAKEAS